MKKSRVFYGYWIVAVAFISLFVYSGVGYYAFALFYKPLEAEFGWGRGDIGWSFTIVFLMQGLASPFIGRLVDRHGAKIFLVLGSLITGLGFLCLYFVQDIWSYYAAYAIVGLGNTGIATIPTTKLVSNWFTRRRGLAIGIAATGVGAAGFVLSPILGTYLIPLFGWRFAYLMLGLITWVLIIPPALLIVKQRPSDMGLLPDGAERTEEIANSPIPSQTGSDWTRKAALKTLPFWLIVIGFMTSTYSHTSVAQHQFNFLTDIGFPVVMASYALGFLGLGSAAGKFAFGWICDRVPPNYVATIAFSLLAIGVIILMNIKSTSPLVMIWLYVVPFGIGMGGWLPTHSLIISRTFGLTSYGAIFGMLSMGLNFGVAFGPTVAGYMYDAMQTYSGVFILLLVLLAIAITSMLSVRRPKASPNPS